MLYHRPPKSLKPSIFCKLASSVHRMPTLVYYLCKKALSAQELTDSSRITILRLKLTVETYPLPLYLLLLAKVSA